MSDHVTSRGSNLHEPERFQVWIAWTILLAIFLVGNVPRADAEVITLGQAHKLALRNNPSLKELDEKDHQAEILRWQAWSTLLPKLFVDGSLTRNNKEIKIALPGENFLTQVINNAVVTSLNENMGTDIPVPEISLPQPTVIQDLWSQRFGATASITLFNAQSIPAIQLAYDQIDSTYLFSQYQRREILYAVTQAYYGVNFSENSLQMAQKDLATSKEFLRRAKARQSVGRAVKVEVLQAKLSVSQAQKRRDDAKDRVELSRTTLAYLIGHKGPLEIKAPASPKQVKGSLEDLLAHAKVKRADLRALDVQTIMADRMKAVTWTRWIPNFDLTYNYSWDSATGFAGEHDSWRLIFGARWNILDGGQKFVELEENASKYRQAQYQAQQLLINIKEEVEKSLLEVAQNRRNLSLTRDQLKLAEETHRLVSKQYEAGLVTGLEVLESTNTLSQARQACVREELNRDLSILKLNKAVGEL